MRDGLFLNPALAEIANEFVSVQLLAGDHTTSETLEFCAREGIVSYPSHHVLRPDGAYVMGLAHLGRGNVDVNAVAPLKAFLSSARAKEREEYRSEHTLPAGALARASMFFRQGRYAEFLAGMKALGRRAPAWSAMTQAAARHAMGDVAGAQRAFQSAAATGRSDMRAYALLSRENCSDWRAMLEASVRWDAPTALRVGNRMTARCNRAIASARTPESEAMLRAERIAVADYMFAPHVPDDASEEVKAAAEPFKTRTQALQESSRADAAWLRAREASLKPSHELALAKGSALYYVYSAEHVAYARRVLKTLERLDDPRAEGLARELRRLIAGGK